MHSEYGPSESDFALNYENVIHSVIGNEWKIELVNKEIFENQGRFLIAFTTSEKGGRGFIKMARKGNENLDLQLKRESEAMRIASDLGIATVNEIQAYREIGDYGVIHLEALNSENGEIPANPELLASADPVFGRWAAETIVGEAGKEIPEGVDTSILKRTDSTTKSVESFWQVWDSSAQQTLESQNRGDALNPVNRTALIALIKEAHLAIEPLIAAAENQDELYFVHGDTAPSNTFFDTKGKIALLLDFEHAGVTHNKLLAQLTDFGNFYARCWPNPDMQKEFLKTLIDDSDKLGGRENALKIAQAAAVFGTINLAKYQIPESHPDYPMAKMLLKHLKENLDTLKTD